MKDINELKLLQIKVIKLRKKQKQILNKMLQSKILFVTLMALLSTLSVKAQSSPPTTCQSATGMQNVNATLVSLEVIFTNPTKTSF